jgi:hypothetical protein
MTLISSSYGAAAAPLPLAERCVSACTSARPVPGHAILLDTIRHGGGPDFALRLSRGGWHRPGRILDANGESIADSALSWLDEAWAETGDDPDEFAAHYADCGYRITRIDGISHYFVAPYGNDSAAFLQLEVEELLESPGHPLIDRGPPPDSVEDLLASPTPQTAEGLPSAGCYSFRRLTDIADIVEKLNAQPGRPPDVLRFLAEWQTSSAGQQRHFCDHWVLALSEHQDRYRQQRCSATPVAANAPQWMGSDQASGIELARQLSDFDRAAGYSAAWYFHLVSGHRVPRSLLPAVHADLTDGMAYLSERDAQLVAAWMQTPYGM